MCVYEYDVGVNMGMNVSQHRHGGPEENSWQSVHWASAFTGRAIWLDLDCLTTSKFLSKLGIREQGELCTPLRTCLALLKSFLQPLYRRRIMTPSYSREN